MLGSAWTKRHFRLQNSILAYYKSNYDGDEVKWEVRCIDIAKVALLPGTVAKMTNVFCLTMIDGGEQLLAGSSQEESKAWVDAIQEEIKKAWHTKISRAMGPSAVSVRRPLSLTGPSGDQNVKQGDGTAAPGSPQTPSSIAPASFADTNASQSTSNANTNIKFNSSSEAAPFKQLAAAAAVSQNGVGHVIIASPAVNSPSSPRLANLEGLRLRTSNLQLNTTSGGMQSPISRPRIGIEKLANSSVENLRVSHSGGSPSTHRSPLSMAGQGTSPTNATSFTNTLSKDPSPLRGTMPDLPSDISPSSSYTVERGHELKVNGVDLSSSPRTGLQLASLAPDGQGSRSKSTGNVFDGTGADLSNADGKTRHSGDVISKKAQAGSDHIMGS
eukprot:jgi/Hompol1/3125/HPOL_003128-RA